MSQTHRLTLDTAHQFGGLAIDRSKPLTFRLNGKRFHGFVGDTVLSAVLAAGVDAIGTLNAMPLALTAGIAPRVSTRSDVTRANAIPIERVAASDGADLVTLESQEGLVRRWRHRDPGSLWLRVGSAAFPAGGGAAEASLEAELLIVGGGVAGLSAAEAAANAGHKVILVERRSWLGGDASFFGALGDEETPNAVVERLAEKLKSDGNVTVLANAEVQSLAAGTVLVQQVTSESGSPRHRLVSIGATRVVLATGASERLPIFAGNRLPGVMGGIEAWHLGERFGVAHGPNAIVATQNNFAYRLALRLNDAGVKISRIADPRINPQSRFVDFAKASGLTLASGQIPMQAERTRERHLRVTLGQAVGNVSPVVVETSTLIVSGMLQPALELWLMAGGETRWAGEKLQALGTLDGVALAGSVAGYRSMAACMSSGKAAVAALFGTRAPAVTEVEPDAAFEAPPVASPIAPPGGTAPTYLDWGQTLLARNDFTGGLGIGRTLSLGGIAALVELGVVAQNDAGAVAEERRIAGGPLLPSAWTPPKSNAAYETPWLTDRFGAETAQAHIIVDDKRRFERGALVYANTSARDPASAIGVIVAPAPDNGPGGIALFSKAALAASDRFIVETLSGPSPARLAPAS